MGHNQNSIDKAETCKIQGTTVSINAIDIFYHLSVKNL